MKWNFGPITAKAMKILALVLALMVVGCYREDREDYTSQGNPNFYYLDENGVERGYFPLVPPNFIEGKYKGLLASVYNRLEYPEEAVSNQTEGRVTIRFTLKPNGTVEDVMIKADIGDGCGDAAAKAVREALQGQPFEPTGEGFDVYGELYISFELF